MARDLDNERDPVVQVHQAVHGYADGHRLLGASTSLEPGDVRRLLVLSDVSGQGAALDKDGYLTGYPLSKSKFYALARTWPAKEMPRPGCVWTHTILISFEDLGRLVRLDNLQHIFRRPTLESTHDSYCQPVELPRSQENREPPVQWKRGDAQRLLWTLYAEPKQKVIASATDPRSTESLALAIWQQQWPRLRRSFLFCTGAASDRSDDVQHFDLQFVDTGIPSGASRFENALDADQALPARLGWIEEAVADLADPLGGELREFLRNFGSDVSGGRLAFAPLCEIKRLMTVSTPTAVEEAVAVIDSTFSEEEAKAVRRLVTSAAAEHTGDLSESSVRFSMRHLHLLLSESRKPTLVRLGRGLWKKDPRILSIERGSSESAREVVVTILAELKTAEIVRGLERCPDLMQAVLPLRPDALERAKTWNLTGLPVEIALRSVDDSRRKQVVRAMATSRGPGYQAQAVREFGAGFVLQVILDLLVRKTDEGSTQALVPWIKAATEDRHALTDALEQRAVRTLGGLANIARSTSPGHVLVSRDRVDPWIGAVEAASASHLEGRDDLYLRSYLVARAMTSESRSQPELLAFGFDSVYIAAAQSRLPEESWLLLEPHFPAKKWFSWDRCGRIRSGIVGAFIKGKFSPLGFAQVTSNPELFRELAELASRKKQGRQFLRRVEAAVREAGDPKLSSHASLISRLI